MAKRKPVAAVKLAQTHGGLTCAARQTQSTGGRTFLWLRVLASTSNLQPPTLTAESGALPLFFNEIV